MKSFLFYTIKKHNPGAEIKRCTFCIPGHKQAVPASGVPRCDISSVGCSSVQRDAHPASRHARDGQHQGGDRCPQTYVQVSLFFNILPDSG